MADRDYYEVLGVSKGATAEEIKKAHRTLARTHHPDLNPDDRLAAETRFKEIQEAYDVLGEPEKRKLYDTYGRAAFQGSSAGPRPGGGEWAAQPGGAGHETFDFSGFFGPGGRAGQAGPDAGFDPGGGNIFEELLGRMRGGRRGTAGGAPRGGRDIESSVIVPFLTAMRGGELPIAFSRPGGEVETLNVKIPAGIEDHAKIRLQGKGEPGPGGLPSGSLVITVNVAPHPYFRREGRNLMVELPISVSEAILGARVDCPTIDGPRTLTIPPGSSSGRKLRLKGQGVPAHRDRPAGDLLVSLKIDVPRSIDDESRRLIEQFASKNPSDPRRGLW